METIPTKKNTVEETPKVEVVIHSANPELLAENLMRVISQSIQGIVNRELRK
jgi:hypothetical protein